MNPYKSENNMELQHRTRVTPKEPIEHVTCPLDFRTGQFQELPPEDGITPNLIEEMPDMSCAEVTVNPDALRKARIRAYQGDYGRELAFDVVGSVGHSFLIKLYRLAPGTYYAPARAHFDELLGGMAEGLLHYVTFTNIDTLHLFWAHTKRWADMTANAVRVNCTYEGMLNTLQVRRIPESMMSERELDRVKKARVRLAKIKADTERKEREQAGGPVENSWVPSKPYHTMEAGETIIMGPEDFNSLASLRVVIYSYGSRNNKRFSVKKRPDGGVTVIRSQ